MLAVAGSGTIPPSLKAGPALREELAMLRGPREHPGREDAGLLTDAPEQDADVKAPPHGPIEHVEEAPSTVRHPEARCQERNGDPDTPGRQGDGLTDPPVGGKAIDERAHGVARAKRIGTRADAGDVGIRRHRPDVRCHRPNQPRPRS